jgi:uncharacterized membrane protein YkoI
MLVSIDNASEKITRWREFYVNGQLKEEGSMVSSVNIHIGTWNYYEPNGSLKQRRDHDKDYPVTYAKALSIAKDNGVKGAVPDVSLTVIDGKTCWEVVQWIRAENGSTADGVYIDTQTGSVTRAHVIGVH